jgi:hypothetical protein
MARLTMQSGDLVPLERVRNRLAFGWLAASALIFVIVVLQSLLGKYGDQVQDAWGWLLPTIMPTLGMIISVLGYTALDPSMLESVVRRSYFRLATGLSVLYLLLVLLTILIQPFAAQTASKSIELMQTSNLWLGPLQGLVASALGALFFSKQKKELAARATGQS